MKIGDRVRVIANLMDGGTAEDSTGAEGVITHVYGADVAVVLLDHEQYGGDFVARELEVIEND